MIMIIMIMLLLLLLQNHTAPPIGVYLQFLDNIYLAHLLSLMGTLSFVFPFHLFSTREESAPHTEAINGS